MIHNSPWQSFPQADLQQFCEGLVDGWVRAPAGAWSNLGLVVVGIIIFILARQKKQNYLALFGLVTIYLGIGSFSYHATNTHIGGVFDLSGMFGVSFFILVTNLWRVFHIRKNLLFAIFVVSVLVFTVLVAINPDFSHPVFAASLLPAFGLQIFLWTKGFSWKKEKFALGTLVCFWSAFFIWRLDVSRHFCVPDNHFIQGHAMWHILNAGAVFFLFLYFSQFKMPELGRGK